jgi:hypothetical protein
VVRPLRPHEQAHHRRNRPAAAVGDATLNISERYNGMDEFMRVVIRVAGRSGTISQRSGLFLKTPSGLSSGWHG